MNKEKTLKKILERFISTHKIRSPHLTMKITLTDYDFFLEYSLN